jgi:predicted nucleotidyltransferase
LVQLSRERHRHFIRRAGVIDIPSSSDLLPHSFEVEAFGVQFKCIDLPTLIRIKEAAGRTKDREAIAELRVLLGENAKNQA